MTPQQLKALLDAATKRPWFDAGNKVGADGHGIAEVDFDNAADMPAIVATMNAAEALVELWEASKELETATLFGFATAQERFSNALRRLEQLEDLP